MKKLLLLPVFLLGFMLTVIVVKRNKLIAVPTMEAGLPRTFLRCMPAGKLPMLEMDSTKPFAPRLDGLGNYHFSVSTNNKDAQYFFDQGLRLYYGFNHMEAYRAFTEVNRLDPGCAMGYWGQALTLGPNINAPMDAADVKKVMSAVQQAIDKSSTASPKEKALIQAIARRYSDPAPTDRAALDAAYTAGMKQAYARFPNDPDIASLYAEAVMDQHPWNYWAKDGSEHEWTPDIVLPLEKVLATLPDHPGANHFYIHAVEASQKPERGLAAAEKLQKLMPGAGHLLHMPSHIYIRTGHYDKGSDMNEVSIKADQAYLTACNSQGLYALIYHPHNYHFLWACATLEGRSATAIKTAFELREKVPADLLLSPFGFGLQHFYATPLFAQVRFGQWNELINTPAPENNLVYVTAMWNYARGVAFAKTGNLPEAKRSLAALQQLESDTTLKNISAGFLNTPQSLMAIAGKVLSAAIAEQLKQTDQAVSLLKEAIVLEDALNYNEPADWHHPVRQVLGQVLNDAGQPAVAERYYREDLHNYPSNGWSLAGLYASLKAQKKTGEAEKVKKMYEKAFVRADINTGRSAF
ncbi:hypothetical protein [uncultured Chitinophaga sp.]|uniref:tetratricopeptide repeat protein n=1 Tax=uncultured Chitinophaga sp. TaxID=339340 RepID=UPI0025E19200|nr:hypothetical protein [uncultured Chitinophaga sp.]